MQQKLLFQGLFVLGFLLCVYSSAMFDRSRVPRHCLKKKPIVANYTPKGEEYRIGNLTVYESPKPRKVKRILIAVPDIFGLSRNMKQVADAIAETYKFRVIMPDFFHGHAWDANNFPPEDEDELDTWMEQYADWNTTVKRDLGNLVRRLHGKGSCTKIGIFGMCWGGKVVTLAASEVKGLKVAGLVHPASVENKEAYGVKIPMYLLPSQDEPDMIPFYNVLKKKFGKNSGHRRFDDMEHGFAGARGNFSDPLNARRVNEVVNILGGFFDKNL